MEMSTSFSPSALSPAALRVGVLRLNGWLPAGAVALLGRPEPALARALRQCGHEVLDGLEGAASAIVVIDHADAGAADECLQPLLVDVRVPLCLLVSGTAAANVTRAQWEAAAMRQEWRKHPLNERLAPYGELDHVNGLLLMAFERVPDAAMATYPLSVLVEERDLHTDMTREAGRRSDAHMARYAQAAQFVRPGDRVIDVACGLGYGSYQLAHSSLAASFVGLDASDYAVDYANTCFAPEAPTTMRFVVGDAQELSGMADGSADFAVSVETLEHLPEPDRLLAELHRVLSPEGRLYASVPNDWSDETGEDPNPFHFHVYDWPRLVSQFHRNGFVIEKAWLQDAGGGQKRHFSVRSMLEIDPHAGPACDGEWLLVLARKAEAAAETVPGPMPSFRALLADGQHEAAVRQLEASFEAENPLVRARARAAAAALATTAGKLEPAASHWVQCRIEARDALTESSSEAEVEAAGLLQLAAEQLTLPAQVRFARLKQLGQGASAIISDLLGSQSVLLGDSNDRAVIAGIGSGNGQANLSTGDVQQLMEAKQWLDGKYNEQQKRIAELEQYNVELEAARRWLDAQYHSLTAEVKRLGQLSAAASGDSR
ncbi:class I SAM-dependent methyltransferase [Stenotrophomonas sp. NPDC077659]|uniref:class I SAM-dependent methyltransferase n=1 Tax=Stenotrophomonas sp. NPDC077659 TaxID=3390694 RepID=UPI003D06CB45